MKIYEDLRSAQSRLDGLQNGLLGLVALLLLQFWLLQGVNSKHYRELAENNRIRTLSIAAPRGMLTDRNGRILAENKPAFKIVVTVGPSGSIDRLSSTLAALLKIDEAEIRHKLSRPRAAYQPVTIKAKATFEDVAAVEARRVELSEVSVEVVPIRSYPQARSGSHVVGRVGEVTDRQLKQPAFADYEPGRVVGQSGLEALYNEDLTGVDGLRRVVVNSRGVEIELSEDQPAQPGGAVELTLSADLQGAMEEAFKDRAGSAVALDPLTGEILGLVSSPGFDPNNFTSGIERSVWEGLTRDPKTPLLNRAIQGQYAPGSLFKVVVAAAGLEEGLVTPESTVYCPGYASIYGHVFRCNRPAGHGAISLGRALGESCNVYFYQLGARLEIERLASYARKFGLGSVSGVDLPSEASGLIPDPAWKERLYKVPWYQGETISVSIGQGQVLATPLQMARMMAAVANGGRLVQPHIVRLIAGRPTPYDAPKSMGFKPSTLAAISRGLFMAVNSSSGSGRQARVVDLEIAGKTGSAQVVSSAKLSKDIEAIQPHAWFAGFAPADDPRIVLAVLVDNGGSGGGAAAPVARAILEKFFGRGAPLPPLKQVSP
ncbi:MAG: penicillin-binding protein 2 [Vicinamibacteria bacterium]|nr:penicillin-binding protein 2 [Vicinamibacteria bacterium]